MNKVKLRLLSECGNVLIVSGYLFIDRSWCSPTLAPFRHWAQTCITWRETARGRAEEKLTVSGGLVLVFGGVGTVSSRRAGAHAEDVPGGWFQTGDDHTGSLGAS